MHKLDRGVDPPCLGVYDHKRQKWDDLATADKQKVKEQLCAMQGDRCAYCEGPLYGKGHIEHFRRKNARHFPQLTFEWINLFLSCDSQDHCGHYKDKPCRSSYNPDDLIKPDVDNPDTFLYFHSSGAVRARSGHGAPDPHRAEETIRVFGLSDGELVAERRRAIKAYIRKDPGVIEALQSFDEQSRREYVRQEIEATQSDPYWTVIRHFFEKVL